MLQILGTIALMPSFHGDHRWRIDVVDGIGTIEAEHPCSDLVRVSVDARTLDELFPSSDALIAAAAPDPNIGADGMRVVFDLMANGMPVCASIWGLSPERHGALWELADGMWRLLYRDGSASYRPYLEHIHTYFRSGLPLRWISPTHGRLYGRLSSNHVEALEAALQRLPEGGTMDMSNFEGMGTLLYPLFRAADARTRARWIVNAEAQRALSAAGVAPERLISTTEGPYRTGRRSELVITSVDAPIRACVEVAALLKLRTAEALDRLKSLPLSLGHFDDEDVLEVMERLLAAGARTELRANGGTSRLVRSSSSVRSR